jgi:hypothetical protein
MHRFSIPALALALLVAGGPAAAQAPAPELRPGERIRVHAPSLAERPVRGGFARIAADTLFLGGRDSIGAAVPLGAVERIDRSRGRTVPALVGGGIGAAILGSIGLWATYVSDAPNPTAAERFVPVAAGAAVGGIFGAVVGSATGERWRPGTWLPGRLSARPRLRRAPGAAPPPPPPATTPARAGTPRRRGRRAARRRGAGRGCRSG